MIKVYKIIIVIFVLIVLSAPSCGDEQEVANREEAILTETKNDIRIEFESDYLTETSLFAYEATAKQKLSDLADYLNILRDTSLDISFREKASEMIKNTFQSENINIQLAEKENESGQELKVPRLIKKGLKNEISELPFSFDSICVHDPLHRIGNNTYTGTLVFSQKFTNTSSPELIIKSVVRKVEIYAVKQEKIFGIDTLNIWNVQLGEIRKVPL